MLAKKVHEYHQYSIGAVHSGPVGDGGEVLGRLGVEVGEGVLQQAVAHPPAKTQSYSQYIRSISTTGKVQYLDLDLLDLGKGSLETCGDVKYRRESSGNVCLDMLRLD
jgi:hypothetical protein